MSGSNINGFKNGGFPGVKQAPHKPAGAQAQSASSGSSGAPGSGGSSSSKHNSNWQNSVLYYLFGDSSNEGSFKA